MTNQYNLDDYKLDVVRVKLIVDKKIFSNEPLDSPDAAIKVVGEMIRDEDREFLCAINLDARLRPINLNVISIGSVNQTFAPLTNIFKSGILSNASSIMLMHNHPSGCTDPSNEDDRLTMRVFKMGKLMELPLVDHIIVGPGPEYYSYSENNRFESFTYDNLDLIDELVAAEKKKKKKTSRTSNKR